MSDAPLCYRHMLSVLAIFTGRDSKIRIVPKGLHHSARGCAPCATPGTQWGQSWKNLRCAHVGAALATIEATGSVVNTSAPGIGSILALAFGGLYHVYRQVRNRKVNEVLVQGVETARAILTTTPQGQALMRSSSNG